MGSAQALPVTVVTRASRAWNRLNTTSPLDPKSAFGLLSRIFTSKTYDSDKTL